MCLNSIHDKAFDIGYITITPDYKILVSEHLDYYSNDTAIFDYFKKYHNHSISLPNKFFPSKEFLDFHYHDIFKK